MMREIKFRAWKHVNTPEMFNDVQVIDFKSGIAHLGYSLSSFTERTDKERLDNLILMQYTGLKDKNGVEIYEGDVLSEGYVVTFIDASEPENLGMDIGFYGQRDNFESWFTLEVGFPHEVIGNIYENPELLGDNQ